MALLPPIVDPLMVSVPGRPPTGGGLLWALPLLLLCLLAGLGLVVRARQV